MKHLKVYAEPVFIGLEGRVKVEALRPDGTKRLILDWFDNLILDSGLDLWGNGSNFLSYCKVGNGTSTPVPTQTALDAQVAQTSTTFATETTGASPTSPYYGWIRRFFQFALGAAVGNLTEVGFGNVSGPLWSRTLFKDGSGNPVPIVVLADEILQVTYEARQYAPLVDAAYSGIVIDGVARSGYVRAASVLNASAWSSLHVDAAGGNAFGGGSALYASEPGLIEAAPTGASFTGGTSIPATYVPGSYYRDLKFPFSLSQGNVPTGVRSATINTSRGVYQTRFDPVLAKNNTKTLELTWRIYWGRRP